MIRLPALPLLVLLLLLGTAASRADEIVLDHGGTLGGTIVKEDDESVVIQVTGMGTMTVERSRIREIRRSGGRRSTPGSGMVRPSPSPDFPGDAPGAAPDEPQGPAREILASFRGGLPPGDDLDRAHLVDHLARLRLLGSRATETLAYHLRYSNDWRVRLLTARALRPLADPVALPSLVHALGDSFHGEAPLQRTGIVERVGYPIRDEAVEAITLLGQAGIAALRATAKDPRHEDQARAVRGLALLRVLDRVPVLLDLARDRGQRVAVRREAVDGLAGESEGAPEALAELFADPDVRDGVEAALSRTAARAAIEGLLRYVRAAAEDAELARRAARAMSTIDARWRPAEIDDAVDYMLFLADPSRIRDEYGDRALLRLRRWSESESVPMKLAARQALACYVEENRPPPPRPRPAPRPSGSG